MYTFKNSGETVWPSDTFLLRVNGDKELQAFITPINRIILPGRTVEVKVNFKNPSQAGNYLAVFRLAHGNNIEFGDKAIHDIKTIVKPSPKVEKTDYAKAIERSEMMLDKFVNVDVLENSFELDDKAVDQSVESNEVQIIYDSPVIMDEVPKDKIQLIDEPKDPKILICQKEEQSVFEKDV